MTHINCKGLFKISVNVLAAMLVIIVLTLLALSFDFNSGVAITSPSTSDDDKELLLAFVVNRHGERTPAQEEAALSENSDVIKKLLDIEGYEGLTLEGKRRAFQIGKFIRDRYGSEHNSLLSKVYLKDQIIVRSTFKDRTQMTAQIAMAALYPPEAVQQWDDGLGKVWQPVPYKAVSLKEDYLRYYSNCDHFKQLMANAKKEAVHDEFMPYNDLIPLLKTKTGANFTEDPLLFETFFDLLRSQVGLGLVVPDWAKPLTERLTEAARLAYMLYFRTDEMKKIGGGVLLNDFVNLADSIKQGENISQPFRLFSAHDFNLGSLMSVTKVENSSLILPEYGAIFSLEFYRCKKSGEYFVLPVYVPQAGDTAAQVMKFHDCDSSYCNFDIFKSMTSQYLLPESEFYTLCNIRTEL